MRLKALLARQAANLARAKEIEAAAGDKPFTDEQRAELKQLREENERLTDDIAEARRLQAQEAALAAAAPKDASQAAGERDSAEAAAVAAGGRQVIVGKDNTQDDPKRGFKDHRDFLRAVMAAGQRRGVDARLKPLAAQGSDEQGTYDDSVGGFLVPHGIAPGILSVAPEENPLTSLFTPVPMTTPIVSFNARVDKNHTSSVSGGFVVSRNPETVDAAASRSKFEQITLRANKEVGLAVATEEVLTDSPISFISIIQAGFRDEYMAAEMREIIGGTGVGERHGALNAGCKITVAKESGQKANTILKENIDKMAARCWRYGRAVWLANHNTRPQLKSIVQAVGTGGSVVPYFLTEGAPAGFDGMLDGRPLLFTEFVKSLGTEGDLILMVPSEYLWGTYQSEQYAESMHVRFAAAERAFRFYRRNDAQWWWTTALTPANGDTLSPVVTLAVRS